MKKYQFNFIFNDNSELIETHEFESFKKAEKWAANLKTDKKIKCWHIFLINDSNKKHKKSWYSQDHFPF